MSDATAVARDQLRSFIERIERLEEEKKSIADDIKDVKAEAKGCGFDVGTINAIIKLRKVDANERAERDALLDTYMIALGMLPEPAEEDYDRESGEILDRDARRRRRTTEAMDDHKSLVDEMADAGLISEEARHENKALADAVATKFGNGPAMAHQSPRKAAEAQSESEGNAVGRPTSERQPETVGSEDGGVTAGETATISPEEAEEEFLSAEREDRAANTALPAKSNLRPFCRKPGETCGGYGRKHCRACEMAAAELEEVA